MMRMRSRKWAQGRSSKRKRHRDGPTVAERGSSRGGGASPRQWCWTGQGAVCCVY
jgi:hypothetical protein